MDRRETFAGTEETLRIAMQGMRAGLWTALPAEVVSFDPVAITAVLQPTIKGVLQKADGTYEAVNLPLLPDVPVVFPRGGGATLTFPVLPGDEALVVFSSRCIDAWWQSGGIQLPMEPRMHDLSDGFALLGPQSQAKKIANLSTTTVQLRSDDGAAFIELNPETHNITVESPSSVLVRSDSVEVNGNLYVSKNLAAGNGATGTFTSLDGRVVTFQDGICTNIN